MPAMKGTTYSATAAICRMPPKITTPVSAAMASPVASLGNPKAPSIASAIEFACTALNTSPKDRIRQTENTAPSQGRPRPWAM
ncbi:hypothetical protein D9M69_726980 [compost metagenome]